MFIGLPGELIEHAGDKDVFVDGSLVPSICLSHEFATNSSNHWEKAAKSGFDNRVTSDSNSWMLMAGK